MRTRAIPVAALVLVLAAACNGNDRPGDPQVYERIAAETDCTVLQQEFDTAMTNAESLTPGSDERKVPLSYAEAAQRRMEELGC